MENEGIHKDIAGSFGIVAMLVYSTETVTQTYFVSFTFSRNMMYSCLRRLVHSEADSTMKRTRKHIIKSIEKHGLFDIRLFFVI